MAGLFDDLLEDKPPSSGLFDDIMAEPDPGAMPGRSSGIGGPTAAQMAGALQPPSVPRRGTMRGGAEPYVPPDQAGLQPGQFRGGSGEVYSEAQSTPTALDKPGQVDWMTEAGRLSRAPAALAAEDALRVNQGARDSSGSMRATGRVDAFMNDVRRLTGSDTAAGIAQVAADKLLAANSMLFQTAKIGADTAQLFGAKDTASKWLAETQRLIDENKSSDAQAVASGLDKILKSDEFGPLDVIGYLAAHPSYVGDQIIQSAGSMGVAVGAARAGGAAFAAIAERAGASAGKVAAARAAGLTFGERLSNSMMNASGTFEETRGDKGDKYLAALISGLGTAAVGKATGDGAEGVIARGAGIGSGALARGKAILSTGGREFVQEGGEQLFNDIGQAAGEGTMPDPQAILKSAAVDATVGLGSGGAAGMTVPVQRADTRAIDMARSKGFLSAPRPTDTMPTVPLTPEQLSPLIEEAAARAKEEEAAKGAPKSAPSTPAGAGNGQGQEGQGRRQEVLTPGGAQALPQVGVAAVPQGSLVQRVATEQADVAGRGNAGLAEGTAPAGADIATGGGRDIQPLAGNAMGGVQGGSQAPQRGPISGAPVGDGGGANAALTPGKVTGAQQSAQPASPGGLKAADQGTQSAPPVQKPRFKLRLRVTPPAGKTAPKADRLAEAMKTVSRASMEVHYRGETAPNIELQAVVPDKDENVDLAANIANAFDAPVAFVRDKAGAKLRFGAVNVGGVILINADTKKAPVTLAMHEVVHGLDRDIKQGLIDTIRQYVPESGRKKFVAEHPTYSDDKVDEEIAAHLGEMHAHTPAFWNEVASRMPAGRFADMAKKILQRIDSLIARFRKHNLTAYTPEIERVRKALAKAYADQAKRIDQKRQPSSDRDTQFAGDEELDRIADDANVPMESRAGAVETIRRVKGGQKAGKNGGKKQTAKIDVSAIKDQQTVPVPADTGAEGIAADASVRRSKPMFSDQTETPEFKRWFGDSKVVDAQGKPLVVYHGTKSDFSEFDPSRAGQNFDDQDERGMLFSSSQVEPNLMADGDGGNVMPVYLSMQNPLVVTFPAAKAISRFGSVSATAWYDNNKREILGQADAGNHDGIIITPPEYKGYQGASTYVAFDPEQIKSAIGNRGTFDPADARIDFSTDNDLSTRAATDQTSRFTRSDSDQALIDLRKRESILKKLMGCLQ